MVTRNDYHLGRFNGDIGITLAAVDNPGALCVYFAGHEGPSETIPARLPSVETAFAMTVHRSQGSEFDNVAVVLPPKPSPVVTRELIYTACTRARRGLTIIGPESVFCHAMENPTKRASGLRDRVVTYAARCSERGDE
jgi:exodeoxyribonuclease V alpha subunit